MFKKASSGKTSAILFSVYCVSVCAGPGCPGTTNPLPPTNYFAPKYVDVPNSKNIIQGAVSPSSLFIVPVMINNAGPFYFIVDTGAAVCTISVNIADQLHLPVDPQVKVLSMGTGGAGTPVLTVKVDKLQIGSMTFGDFLAAKADYITFKDLQVQGVIGISLFHNLTTGIDYPHKQLIVQTDPLPANECNIHVGGFDITPEGAYDIPFVDVQAAGRPIRAIVDSGYSGILGVPQSLSNLPFAGPMTIKGYDGVNGHEDVKTGILNGDVIVGCRQIKTPSVDVNSLDHGLIGAGGWQKLTLWLDQRSKLLRLEGPGECGPNHDCISPDPGSQGCPTIAGTWNTIYGEMTLSENGSGSTTAYGYTDTITVDSLVMGDDGCPDCLVLDGRWVRTDGSKSGYIHFVFEPDNKHFEGLWSQDPEPGWRADPWTGFRESCN